MNTKKWSALYIVTGTSRGLGEALASQFIKPGNELIAISRTPNASLQKKAEQTGVPFRYIRLDLAQLAEERDAQQLLAGIWAETDLGRFNRLCLINNAGVLEPIGPAHTYRAADVAKHLAVNLTAPILLTAAFLQATQHIDADKRIMQISSGAGRKPYFGWSAYCAGKAGLDHFTRCVHLEQQNEPYGARIASVAPGVVETAMQERIRRTDERSFPDRSRFVKLYETGRTTPPHEVAQRLLSFLDHDDFGKEPVVDIREWKG